MYKYIYVHTYIYVFMHVSVINTVQQEQKEIVYHTNYS